MTQSYVPPDAQPPRKKGLSGCAIAAIVVATLALLGLGTCAVGAFWLKGKAEKALGALADGGAGIVLEAPAAVKTALAGPKKEYVGAWHAANGSELVIGADGNVKFKNTQSTTKETVTGPIAAFAGNDIDLHMIAKIVIAVSRAPHKVGDHWEMTADGIDLQRK